MFDLIREGIMSSANPQIAGTAFAMTATFVMFSIYFWAASGVMYVADKMKGK